MLIDRPVLSPPCNSERRHSERVAPANTISVDSGIPRRDGVLRDISTTGISVEYPSTAGPVNPDVEIGELVRLNVLGGAQFIGRVTRIFEGGFAMRFDNNFDTARRVI